ncbi:MAG: hypothetical protein A2289_02490 [Deltaproteobacteria bacterium RIFOXYA12_FULL_58_15]|nr:MAG: hypothetical protein A2289_02490 [Deltaproteobacteria bacterium RIFOXYA12_FULL_58_15]OGR09259.1 MAG: hypothetical protein A2341_24250 [Deltaproteobacteria bacterium RIFOXYB12_FULL_58_9]
MECRRTLQRRTVTPRGCDFKKRRWFDRRLPELQVEVLSPKSMLQDSELPTVFEIQQTTFNESVRLVPG